MSIVAVKIYEDRIAIASDSITVRGWTQSKSRNSHSKLVCINNLYIGSAGLAEESSLLQVFCSTRRPEQATESAIINFFSEFSDWKCKKIGNASVTNDWILVMEDKVFLIEGFFVQEVFDFAAIGAGMDFALATLHLGHDVKKAVEIACELSVYCELPVKVFDIKKGVTNE